ncbi:unnamed protein product [Auanema sp. JU1783]|nr:unnamed protein product [Auanema sp. JU1783]
MEKNEKDNNVSDEEEEFVEDEAERLKKRCEIPPYQPLDRSDDEIVTLQDIIDSEEELNERAKLLFGGSDIKVCTYPEGYKPRQAVFTCLTCAPPPKSAAVCFGCSLNCHEGHLLIELYTKRNIRCDCGNSIFDQKCLLYEEKDPINEQNKYNHNYKGVFCTCLRPYPDLDCNDEMYQCVICEDWFHFSHLKIRDTPSNTSDICCFNCAEKHPFLQLYWKATAKVCLKGITSKRCGKTLVFDSEWRKFICRCSHCEDMLSKSNLSFLLVLEDTIANYEETSLEMTRDENDTVDDGDTLVKELVKTTGREGTVTLLKGFNDLKTNLGEFFSGIAATGDVITKEHVASFFENMKRPRLDNEGGSK